MTVIPAANVSKKREKNTKTVYIIIGTKLEEKKLVLEFGETYIKYQTEVPMLIPFTKVKEK